MRNVVLTGKTCSGKSSVVKELCDKYGYSRIMEYTTRPIRDGEVDGIDYHFVTNEVFDTMEINGDFAECNAYSTEYGIWKYGALKADFNGESHAVGMGVLQMKQCMDNGIDAHYIMIDASDSTVVERSSIRGDAIAEINRRLRKDNILYEDAKLYLPKEAIVDGNRPFDEVMEAVRKIIAC